MLELAILGLLQHRELHGYEIRKRLRDELGLFSNVSFGALYPALSRLERGGAVTTVDEAPQRAGGPVPMTGSLGGERAALRSLVAGSARSRRSRRVYRITEAGRTLFVRMLHDDPAAGDDPRGFGLRLALARHLPPQARIRLLERRRVQVEERLAASRSVAAPSAELDHYVLALLEHTGDAAAQEIAWLDGLIDAERAALAGAHRGES